MLTHISIRNFALIDNLEWQLEPGLNILTGETGAGKSIIIDAVGLIIGNRASQEYIRTGCEYARVDAIFDLSESHGDIQTILEKYGLDFPEDYQLLISREIQKNGKGITRINSRLTTISVLREIGSSLIDIHGQNEHQSVMKAERHIDILDSFIGESIKGKIQEYQAIFNQIRNNRKKQKDLGGDVIERNRQIELYEYQYNEISSANLLIGEEESLEREKTLIGNSEKLFNCVETARENLYERQENLAAIDLIGKASIALQQAAQIDDNCHGLLVATENISYAIDDLIRDIRIYRESIEFNPERIVEVETRLDIIFRLKRKYGNSVEEIVRFGIETAEQIEKLKNSEAVLAELKHEEEAQLEILGKIAGEISTWREQGAGELRDAIMSELTDLGMKKVDFQVSQQRRLSSEGIPFSGSFFAYHARGIDDVEFLISTNPGEPVKPLVKIASGGEISRIMLGIKAVLAFSDKIPTLIFDEVDAGIGGRAAQSVSKKLKKIATECQVLCVTHLPQIAAAADVHFYIDKETVHDRTETRMKLLSREERIIEIVRMLAGDQHTEAVYRHAQEMIDQNV